ncbi:hypothetical protein C7B67_17635, partial [filamentous cyanobacterium Phorm 6]
WARRCVKETAPLPASKKQKLTQTKQLLTLAEIPASDKLDGWECKKHKARISNWEYIVRG